MLAIRFIGASLSKPHTSGSPTQFWRVYHAQTTTDKTGKLTIRFPCRSEIHSVDYCTSLFVSCRQPCRGEIHGVDYCTSLFVSCRQPCRGEIHGVDYCTSLFVSCRRPCHGELQGKPDNFAIKMNREERLRRRRELYRLRRDRETPEQREERLQRERENARRRRGRFTEQQMQEILP